MSKKSIFIALFILVLILGLLFQALQKTSAIVTVERSFNAPTEKVWQLWTETESIKQWWSPKGFTAPVVQNDFRENGAFLLSMKAPDGKVSWNVGKYTEIIPNQKIASRMSFADEKGQSVPASHYGIPGNWPDEVNVLVEFTSINDHTQVRVTETGIPAIMYLFAKMGWEQQFDKFESLLK